MGHERIGYLPKTKKWRRIVDDIGNFSATQSNVVRIASETTKNVRSQFKRIEEDKGVLSAFKFIILLAYSSSLKNSTSFLKKEGINLPNSFNLFDLTTSIQDFVSQNQESKEYSSFASQ